MKVMHRKIYLKKEDLKLIETDINAQPSYTVFSNEEKDTVEVDVQLEVQEQFLLSEETLDLIVEGLLPGMSENELLKKKNELKVHLRSIGAGV